MVILQFLLFDKINEKVFYISNKKQDNVNTHILLRRELFLGSLDAFWPFVEAKFYDGNYCQNCTGYFNLDFFQ